MKKQSAGILLYKHTNNGVEVLLGHPGGPFWVKKDAGAWSIPKGEFTDEEPQAAAKREFDEELGSPAPEGDMLELGSAKQSSGKVVYAWAIEADFDTKQVKSNTIDLEWPPKSGQTQQFPEIDRAGWFSLFKARSKLVKGQVPLLESLAKKLGVTIIDEPPEAVKVSAKSKPKSEGQTSLF